MTRLPRRRAVGRRGTTRGRPGSRTDRWLASWRFALRLGRREVRRHPGRSLLIAALVALPVLLISGFLTFFTSQDVSMAEGVDRELGTAAASVFPSSSPIGLVQGVGQAIDPSQTPLVADGFTLSDPWDAERISATVGAPVTRVGRTQSLVEGLDAVDTLVLDAPPEGVTEPFGRLIEGRWASAAGEVVVTRAGVAAGLPESGSLAVVLGQEEAPTQLRIVGVADAVYASSSNAALVLPAVGAPEETSWEWLVDRTDPVHLLEAEQWALHGLDVKSRQIQLHPPDVGVGGETALKLDLFYAMVGLAVLVETVLLAGPAFAVSAARQRHSLALAGAQGAAREDVRRAVVAHGLVLALASTLAAAALGLSLGALGAFLLTRSNPLRHVEIELPLLWTSLLVMTSVLAAGLAAWWPARGATRLDLMSVLRGQVVSPRVGRGWPVVGAVLTVAGGAALVAALQVEPLQATIPMLGGATLLGLGAMTLVPAVLALVARLSAGAPLAWRLAARDSLRQRSRAVPAVLAIVAAVGVMAATATVQTSATANQERQYAAQLPEGTLAISHPDVDAGVQQDMVEAAQGSIPGVTAYPLAFLVTGPGMDPRMGEPLPDAPVQGVVEPGCTAEQVTATWPLDDSVPPCFVEPSRLVSVVPVEALAHSEGFTPEMREVLEAGGVVLWGEGAASVAGDLGVGDGLSVRASATSVHQDGVVELTSSPTLTPVQVYRASSAEMDALRVGLDGQPLGYVTPETAAAIGWEDRPGSVFVAKDGPITSAEAGAVEATLEELNPYVYLEEGFVPEPEERVLMLVLLAVFSVVALGAVVISTALTISEGQQDSATLAAIGGTRRTRRALAAGHALLVGAVGTLVGLALGMTIGVVMSWVQTSTNAYSTGYGGWSGDGGVISVPWASLALAAAAIPLIAAAVGWISVRGAPVMTRALT